MDHNNEIDDDLVNQRKKTSSRDPLSHRIIEKRRRDRMNNCLADLSRLIPASYLKKGRGRVEKTEIIEMAIKHLKHLHNGTDEEERVRHFRSGFHECLSETVRFLVEVEGLFTGDGLCQRLMAHLQNHVISVDHEPITRPVTNHLREMLESAPKQKTMTSPAMTSSPEIYSFKKEIKDRFENQRHDDDDHTNLSSDLRSDTSGYSSSSSCPSLVPIFALHPSHNFYVPLTVDSSLIHFVKDDSDQALLHPINIMVNFNSNLRPQYSPINCIEHQTSNR